MKLNFLLSIFIILSSLRVSAQCTPAIPSTAVVVSTTQSIDGGFDPIWVCNGATLHSDGGFHNVYLEPGATMTTEGGIDTIYVKDGATLYMDGGIHVIFYVSASDLHISGGIPYENSCSAITFDYTNAPSNGCSVAVTAGFESGDSILCSGTCINFYSLSENATSWEWSFSGANPSTSTDENPVSICYNDEGIFDVTLIASNGNNSDTLTLSNFITVNSVPVTPTLSQNGDTLFSSQGYVTYQWYLDNNAIPGATNYFYVATQNGEYTVLVTNSKACEATASIEFVNTGISALSDDAFKIFPNPAMNSIVVWDDQEEFLYFTDLLGRNLFSMKTSSSGKTTVDISSLPSLFFVRTERGDLSKVIRIE